MSRRAQHGSTTVEFAIIGASFFIVLFATIELGRALFTWNGLVEATRRGARVAAVCPVNHSAIERVALFDGPGGDGASPILPGLGPDNIVVSYLDENGAAIAGPAVNPGFASIRYVRVTISGYEHSLLIPLFELSLNAPDFATTLPRESLGIPREGAGASCFGTPI